VRRKLVKKVRAADDARRVELTLTPAGVALLRRAPEAMQTRLTRAIQEIDETERGVLAHGLQQLVHAMGADRVAPPMFFEAGQ
jgi:DNA-binding MarR family transcriptional regulator